MLLSHEISLDRTPPTSLQEHLSINLTRGCANLTSNLTLPVTLEVRLQVPSQDTL